MTKDEAAHYLNVSTRQVERYTNAGELSVTYERGKTRKVPVYDEREVAALKTRFESVTHRPAVVREENETAPHALVRASDAPSIADFGLMLKSLSERLQSPATRPSVAIENKPLLKIAEASQLTGLSYQILRAAIEDKQLKAKMLGRAWRIKRADLDAFIKRL